MNSETTKSLAFIAVVGAVALGAGNSSWAAPVLSGTLAVKTAAPSAVSHVRYYHYRGYRGRGGYFYGPSGYYGYYNPDHRPREGINYYSFDRPPYR